MAIYHLHVKVIQRSKGQNVIAASAYRRAARLRDHKEEKDFDFTAKKHVIYSDLMVPDNAPDWVKKLLPFQFNSDRLNSNRSDLIFPLPYQYQTSN
jgi:hypothetical protein